MGNMVILEDQAPYTPRLERDVLLNPMARTAADKEGSFFPEDLPLTRDNAAVSCSIYSLDLRLLSQRGRVLTCLLRGAPS